MKKTFLTILGFLGLLTGLFLQLLAVPARMGLVLSPVLLAAVFLFWMLPFWLRLGLGMVLGFILDSVGTFPFGTYILALTTISVFTQTLKNIFSNIDSIFTKGVANGIIVFLSFSLLYPMGYMLGIVQGLELPWQTRAELMILAQTVFYSFVIISFFSLAHFLKLRTR